MAGVRPPKFGLNATSNSKKRWVVFNLFRQGNSNLAPSCKEGPLVTSKSEDSSPVGDRLLENRGNQAQAYSEMLESRLMKAFEQNETKERTLEHQSCYVKAVCYRGHMLVERSALGSVRPGFESLGSLFAGNVDDNSNYLITIVENVKGNIST